MPPPFFFKTSLFSFGAYMGVELFTLTWILNETLSRHPPWPIANKEKTLEGRKGGNFNTILNGRRLNLGLLFSKSKNLSVPWCMVYCGKI